MALNRTTIIDVSRVEFDLVKYCCALDVKARFMCCTAGVWIGHIVSIVSCSMAKQLVSRESRHVRRRLEFSEKKKRNFTSFDTQHLN